MTSEIKTKDCDCCMWDDMGYKHEPSCSSITTQSADKKGLIPFTLDVIQVCKICGKIDASQGDDHDCEYGQYRHESNDNLWN